MPAGRRYRVVDVGSRISGRQTLTHRELLEGRDCDFVGVDVQSGRNVDVVMERPYRIPLRRGSADVVLCGQVLEHVPFFWVTLMEMARVLKPGGHVFLTVPSRGHVHDDPDCWRFYPDGIRAMAAFAGLDVREARTDFPPTKGRRRHDYAAIDSDRSYWGDTVGVLSKPLRRPFLGAVAIREALVWWANRIGGLGSPGAGRTPNDDLAPARERTTTGASRY